MNIENLLLAKREVYALIPRPNDETKFWSMHLDGLHSSHVITSAKTLRNSRKKPNLSISGDPTLKVNNLHNGLARLLGGRSIDHWREVELKLEGFLRENGMTVPTDLIKWESFSFVKVTARQISDRIFKSNLPQPKRIFTGVGSRFFKANGIGLLDLTQQAQIQAHCIEAHIKWSESNPNEVVPTDPIKLTRRELLLHAYAFSHVKPSINLLGDSLVDPMLRPTEHRLYGASDIEKSFNDRIFSIFREEIEKSDAGWVEIIKYPGLDNIVFLKGLNGSFDWVIRDQRDSKLTGNPYSPFFKNDELPSAMPSSEFNAHLYFKCNHWLERIEHEAENRHYIEGGTTRNWPGYPKLLLRELIASKGYCVPSGKRSAADDNFTQHRLDDRCLMVSPLISIKDFYSFYENTDWVTDRVQRVDKNNQSLEANLLAVNNPDEKDSLPASLTWYDAVAYCRDFERRTGLAVRLLSIEEWRQISPPKTMSSEDLNWSETEYMRNQPKDEHGQYSNSEGQYRGVIDQFNNLGCCSESACSGKGSLRFAPNLNWLKNSEGLPFLAISDFGEWLGDYSGGYAPVVNVLTGESLNYGELESDKRPATSTMRNKGMKIGFRLCYTAKHDG